MSRSDGWKDAFGTPGHPRARSNGVGGMAFNASVKLPGQVMGRSVSQRAPGGELLEKEPESVLDVLRFFSYWLLSSGQLGGSVFWISPLEKYKTRSLQAPRWLQTTVCDTAGKPSKKGSCAGKTVGVESKV